MKSAASRQVLYLTETAAMTALLIILQAATKPAGQYVTGTCVNAVLALSVLAAGLWSGVAVALLSPVFAFLLGIGPQLLPIVPSIAAGNLVYVLLLGLLAGGQGASRLRQAAGCSKQSQGDGSANRHACQGKPNKQNSISGLW